MDWDEILHEVGDNGKYQHLMLWLVFLPAQLSFGCHAYGLLFMTWTPDHWCKVSELASANLSEQLLKYLTVPRIDNEEKYSQCEMYDRNYSVHTPRHTIQLEEPNDTWTKLACHSGWLFNRSLILDRETAVTKWDLVCAKSHFPILVLASFIAFGFIGQCISHLIASRLGKRVLFFTVLFIQSTGGLATAFSPNFIFFVVFMNLVGITVPSILLSPSSMAFEIIGAEMHGALTLLHWTARSIGVGLLAAITFYVRDYSNLALATTVPFLAFFLYAWVFPESPQWLLSTGRYEETGRLLRNIAATNGKRLSPDYVVSLQRRFRIELALQEDKQRETGGHTLCDLLSTPNMRRKVILLIFIWSFSSTSSLGLTYFAFQVAPGEGVHHKFTACAIAEILSVIVAFGILQCSGRRCATFITCAFSGALCLICVFLSSRTGWLLSFIVHVAAKLFAQAALVLISLWSREHIPAVIKAEGYHFIETSSLVLPLILPFILHQGKIYHFLPLMIFGGLQFTSAILALCLPETKHIKTLQTLHDGEIFGKYWKCKDYLRCGRPKIDHKNGILKSLEKKPQSPILGLLRKRDSFHLANAEGEIEMLECHSDTCSGEKAVKVTVL